MNRIKKLYFLFFENKTSTEILPFNSLSVRAFKKIFPSDSYLFNKDKSEVIVKLNDNVFKVTQGLDPKGKNCFIVTDKKNNIFYVYWVYFDTERQGHVEYNIDKLLSKLKESSYDIYDSKLTVDQATKLLPIILKTENIYLPKDFYVDWGSMRGRKQGKRIGDQVVGGMGDSVYFQGIHTYKSLFGNLPDYEKLITSKDTTSDLSTIINLSKGGFGVSSKDLIKYDSPDVYLKARSYGLNHSDAMLIVYLYNK